MCHHVARLLFHNAQSFNKVFLKLYAKFCSLGSKYNIEVDEDDLEDGESDATELYEILANMNDPEMEEIEMGMEPEMEPPI